MLNNLGKGDIMGLFLEFLIHIISVGQNSITIKDLVFKNMKLCFLFVQGKWLANQESAVSAIQLLYCMNTWSLSS